MKIRFTEIRGLNLLKRKLFKLGTDSYKELADSFNRAGMIIERRAKQNISGQFGHVRHVKTGNLMSSIKTDTKLVGTLINTWIGTDVYYAYHVEKLPDCGYLFPAFEETQAEVMKYLEDEVSRMLSR